MSERVKTVDWRIAVTGMICITALAIVGQIMNEQEIWKFYAVAIIAWLIGIPMPQFWKWRVK